MGDKAMITHTVASFFALLEKVELEIIMEKTLTGLLVWKKIRIAEPMVLPEITLDGAEYQVLSYIIQKAATLAPIPKAGLWVLGISDGKIKEAGEAHSPSLLPPIWGLYHTIDISIYEALDRVLPVAGLRMFLDEDWY